MTFRFSQLAGIASNNDRFSFAPSIKTTLDAAIFSMHHKFQDSRQPKFLHFRDKGGYPWLVFRSNK